MNTTRKYWLDTMLKIVSPVITALSEDKLKKTLIIESMYEESFYSHYAYLECFGRVINGISAWLGCKDLNGEEEELRKHYAELARRCIKNAVNPESNDFMDFTPSPSLQPIVDAAMLAQGILRAPDELWHPLDEVTKKRLIESLKKTRAFLPHKNNWVLFSAMIECMIFYSGEPDWDRVRIDYALDKLMEWYKGDGWYGDGPEFCFDYYNSNVIHPMLTDIINCVGNEEKRWGDLKERILSRSSKYATWLEKLISPDGTYPLIGRSLVGRFGVFHCLSHMAYKNMLEECISPAQVRCALTAVIKKLCSYEDMFDENGWLTIGVCGYQLSIAESYVCTSSSYFCTVVFMPLGLGENDDFWAGEDMDWTQKAFWKGKTQD